jgi:hypothetical protein
MIQFKQGETVWIGRMEYVVEKIWSDGGMNLHPTNPHIDNTTIEKEEAQAFLRHAPYDVPDEKPKAKFADAKVGDKVWSVSMGDVIITDIDSNDSYPIIINNVVFDMGGFDCIASIHPTLFLSKQDCIDYWKSQEGK